VKHLGESTETCAVRAHDRSFVSATEPGVSDRFGASPTVIAGVAPHGVKRVVLHDSDGRRVTLALSTHRAFLALVRPRLRRRVWVISESSSGHVSTRRFSLPVPAVQRHPVRRRGAVFNDEIGETITSRSYAQVVRRFGRPARERTEGAERCAYYEIVGRSRAWRFCFGSRGRMVGANGGARLP
jgi:hypothetical protein